ncbi:MAG: TetR/AcrR family transcriptional regulator [Actinomycetota bacterium]|nr:TetR/AcrR family transcriptional regulator [Actinomycetota bacterium]
MTTGGPQTETEPVDPPRGRPQRADARRNYERLLETASKAFVAEGAEASLDEIARQAGVGIGTLYRHFPTRQCLLEAVFLDQVDDLRVAAQVLAADPVPIDALARWLRAHITHGRKGHSLGSSVMSAKLQEGSEVNLACRAMLDAGQALLARAQDAGQVRADVALTDVLKMVHGIVLVTEGAPGGDERAARMLDLLIGGVRSSPS